MKDEGEKVDKAIKEVEKDAAGPEKGPKIGPKKGPGPEKRKTPISPFSGSPGPGRARNGSGAPS